MSEKEKGTNGSRFREIVSVLRKHNITHGLSPKKLRLIMEDLGPTFVKIGQIMALHSDVLPKAYCDELMELCTDARPMPFEEAVAVIDESYGRSWKKVFSSIEETPIGSASIAQVHRAVLKTFRQFFAITIRVVFWRLTGYLMPDAEISQFLTRLPRKISLHIAEKRHL